MSITKKTDGRPKPWIYDYTDARGIRRNPGFRLEREAIAARTEIENQLKTGNSRNKSNLTFADLAKEHLDGRMLGRATRNGYSSKMDLHILPYLGGRKVNRIEFADVERYRDMLLVEKKLSGPFVKEIMTLVRSVFRLGQRRYGLHNPAIGVRTPGSGTRKREIGIDIPTSEEVNLLLDSVSDWWHPFFYLAVQTGMRPGELRGLNWKDVDLERGFIHVRQAAAAGSVDLKKPKTDLSHRSIPISQKTIEVLRGLLSMPQKLPLKIQDPERNAVILAAGINAPNRQKIKAVAAAVGATTPAEINAAYAQFKRLRYVRKVLVNNKFSKRPTQWDDLEPRTADPDDPVFLTVAGNRVHPSRMYEAWDETLAKAGLEVKGDEEKYQVYGLRHYFASAMANRRGMTFQRLAKLMGHSRIEITMNRYAHLFPDTGEDRAMMEAQDRHMIGRREPLQIADATNRATEIVH